MGLHGPRPRRNLRASGVFSGEGTEPNRCAGCISPKPTANSARSELRRLPRTAHSPKSPSGSAEIRHPFHPLRGQRFAVLKARRVSGVETLLLRDPRGRSLVVPREWTDLADIGPSSGSPRRFAIEPLLELVALVEALRSAKKKVAP
jgi:hypothetical protein